MKFNIIAAVETNNGIGIGGKIPWNIKDDMKFFSRVTIGNIVIMGYKTFLSIGNPLKNRYNIVLSKNDESIESMNKKYKESDIKFMKLSELVEFVEILEKEYFYKEAFIIGGEQIYKIFIDNKIIPLSKLHITKIEKKFDCDTFFPQINYKLHLLSITSNWSSEENCYFTINCYEFL